MKIAIVGTGLAGMQAALYFHSLECQVILLGAEAEVSLEVPVGGELARLGALCPEMVSNLSMQDLVLPEEKEAHSSSKLTFGEIAKLCHKLGQACEDQGLLTRGHVTLIRKCTLTLDGPLTGDARMRDLFRLHYRQSGFESFVDVDVVIDARGPGHPISLSLDGARALGESDVKSSRLIYGIPTVAQWQEVEKNLRTLQSKPDPIRILICGTGMTSACLFLKWIQILQNTSHVMSLVIVSSEEKFYGQLKSQAEGTDLLPILEAAIDWGHDSYQAQYQKYLNELKAWENLEDYMQAKVVRPISPRFQIEFVADAHIQAIDAPVDRQDLFITYDTVRWDKNELINKGPFTVGGDFVFVATKRYQEQNCQVILRPDEPGFYRLGHTPSLKDGILNIELIKRDLSRFFHRA